MKKTILEGLLGIFGVERTETFFSDVQETREAMQRLLDNELHPLDGDDSDHKTFQYMKVMALNCVGRNLNGVKKQITLLTPRGRWCYVPEKLQSTLDVLRKKEKFYSQFYWDASQNRRVYV